MSMENEEGKVIEKLVPETIASTYAKIGWKVVEEKKTIKEDKKVKLNTYE